MHGGGNLGDRYGAHQALRAQVLSDFPDRRVLLLPQSMEFLDERHAVAMARAFAAHRNFTLCLREQQSHAAAQRLFGDTNAVEFCPDAAFGAGPVAVVGRPQVALLALLRTDGERVPRDYPFLETATVTDWHLTTSARTAWRATEAALRICRRSNSGGALGVQQRLYGAQAHLNLAKATRVLSTGRTIFTDRLHAAILAALLGLPVIAMDNNYGKIYAVYDSYLRTLPRVYFAHSVSEAQQQMRDLAVLPSC